jgi:N-acetylneuraminic acid mutarotase
MYSKIGLYCWFVCLVFQLNAGDWIQKATFGGVGRHRAVGCGTSYRGYLGLGHVNGSGIDISYKDWWEYDPASDSWTQKADYPVNNHGAVSFVVNNMPCVGGGSALAGEFYQFNPQLNVWTSIASCPFFNPGDTQGFSVNEKGYVYLSNQLAEYDPVANQWNLMPQAPINFGTWSCSFAVGSSGFIKSGNKLYEFKPNQQTWLQRSDFPGVTTGGSSAFTINNMGYVTCGYVGGLSVVTDQVWAYNLGVNQWITVEEFKGTSRRFPVAFSIDNKGYFGTGTNGANFNDFWQYNPSINSTFEKTGVEVSCFPNPTMDRLTFQKESFSSINRIELVDNYGAVVFQKDLMNDVEQISVEAFPAGFYQVLFYNQNVLVDSQKISVQK